MRYFNLRQFNGGLVNTASVGIGKEAANQFRYGQNIRTRNNEVVPRSGVLDYCDFSLAPAIMGQDIGVLYEYNREYFAGGSTDILHLVVFAVGTSLFYIAPDDSTTVAIAISPALLSGDFYAANCFDHLFIGNGREAVKVFDGSVTLRQAGITPPSPAGAWAVLVAGGGLTEGHYRRYRYTYYRDADPYDIESNPAVRQDNSLDYIEVGPFTAVNKQTQITFTAPADSQVTHFYLYATETYADPNVPETTYYFAGAWTTATLVVPDHNVPNSDLTDNAALDTMIRDVPPQIKYMLHHDARIFGAGEEANPSIIYYCQVGKPFYWDTREVNGLWDEVSRDDGDVITGLAAIGRTRYIFKTRSIWEWTGDPESITPITPVERPDASQNMTRVGVGCADPRSLTSWVNSLIFRAANGHVYLLTVSNLTMLSQYVETDIKSLGAAAKAAVLDDHYIISDGDKTMVCDLRRQRNGWEGFDVGIDPNGLLVDHNGYLLGSEGDKIIRYYTGTQDNGVDFTKIFQTSYPNLLYRQSAMSEAIYRQVIANCRVQDSDFAVSIYNETEALVDSGTYVQSARLYSLPRGQRGISMSARLQWTGSNVISGTSLGYLLGRRH